MGTLLYLSIFQVVFVAYQLFFKIILEIEKKITKIFLHKNVS